jgi:hypothetical protein
MIQYKPTMKRFAQAIRTLWAICTITALMTAPVLAQRKGRGIDDADEPKNYVPVYLMIITCVGLALVLICRSSRRSVDFRSMDE